MTTKSSRKCRILSGLTDPERMFRSCTTAPINRARGKSNENLLISFKYAFLSLCSSGGLHDHHGHIIVLRGRTDKRFDLFFDGQQKLPGVMARIHIDDIPITPEKVNKLLNKFKESDEPEEVNQ